ncbi:MAG: hypothetical protein HYY76_15555 [Acidobacteria bacterium]|nr:hypothetical protein [Acidobacteriota bacterium]
MGSSPLRYRTAAIAVLATLVAASTSAQERVGGHFGAVIPLVTRANGTTTTVADDFVIGFPTGITIRTSPRWAFDLELVPSIQNEPLHVDLTVHPGVIASIAGGFGAGLRMAFDVRRPSWGFTPIFNRGFPLGAGTSLFGELVVPIRFQIDPFGERFTSVGLGVHAGIGF